MSIRKKLTLIMSGSVLIILLLNIALSLYTTQVNLRQDSESKMIVAARQIAASVEQSQYSSAYVEQQMGEILRMASILAAKVLDPDINNINNEQLKKLSKEVGVTHISLLVRTNDDIIVARSSDPHEIGVSTRNWGYWYTAFNQLFNLQQVTGKLGVYADNFWAGPFEYSSSSPDYIDKWGYYYDAKRNYMIDPFIRSDAVNNYAKMVNPEEVLKRTKTINPQILEITCVNPLTFGNRGMTEKGYDSYNVTLADRPIRYGTYIYGNMEKDTAAVNEAVQTENSVSFETRAQGKKVLKSFIPIIFPNKPTYVISVVTDYESIYSVMREQFISHIVISLLLFVMIILGSYLLAGYVIRPIESILIKVKDVADGHFDNPLMINSKDELGILSSKINVMTHNLSQYTNQLKQAVEENRSVKDHLESVIQQTADAIHTVDWSGRIIQVNAAFEKLYGWTSNEVVGKSLNLIPDFLKEEEEGRLKALKQGKQLPPAETIHLKKNGQTVEVSISTSPVRDEDGVISSFISVSRDMTERNRMDELLRRSEKLTTVGQLAAGVAHEIRNPLTTLRGFLQLQQQNNRLSPQHNEIMLSELERINLIVSEFLILAKPQAVQFQVKDVRSILKDVVSLLDSQAHLIDIQFAFDFTYKETMIRCEENQLKQVFINIIKNAMESMPLGGVVTLRLYRPEHECVVICIEDQGIGIPENIMPKLGEPFFTNKENGTGLGLMVSQRIIEGHKGTIEIESVHGKGTKVAITLPTAVQ